VKGSGTGPESAQAAAAQGLSTTSADAGVQVQWHGTVVIRDASTGSALDVDEVDLVFRTEGSAGSTHLRCRAAGGEWRYAPSAAERDAAQVLVPLTAEVRGIAAAVVPTRFRLSEAAAGFPIEAALDPQYLVRVLDRSTGVAIARARFASGPRAPGEGPGVRPSSVGAEDPFLVAWQRAADYGVALAPVPRYYWIGAAGYAWQRWQPRQGPEQCVYLERSASLLVKWDARASATGEGVERFELTMLDEHQRRRVVAREDCVPASQWQASDLRPGQYRAVLLGKDATGGHEVLDQRDIALGVGERGQVELSTRAQPPPTTLTVELGGDPTALAAAAARGLMLRLAEQRWPARAALEVRGGELERSAGGGLRSPTLRLSSEVYWIQIPSFGLGRLVDVGPGENTLHWELPGFLERVVCVLDAPQGAPLAQASVQWTAVDASARPSWTGFATESLATTTLPGGCGPVLLPQGRIAVLAQAPGRGRALAWVDIGRDDQEIEVVLEPATRVYFRTGAPSAGGWGAARVDSLWLAEVELTDGDGRALPVTFRGFADWNSEPQCPYVEVRGARGELRASLPLLGGYLPVECAESVERSEGVIEFLLRPAVP
jgi:hypothetical protein